MFVLGLITLLFFVVLAGLVVWWVCCGLRWFPGVWFLLHGLVGFWVCGFDGGCGCFVGVGVVGCSYWLIVLVFDGSGRLLLFVVSWHGIGVRGWYQWALVSGSWCWLWPVVLGWWFGLVWVVCWLAWVGRFGVGAFWGFASRFLGLICWVWAWVI